MARRRATGSRLSRRAHRGGAGPRRLLVATRLAERGAALAALVGGRRAAGLVGAPPRRRCTTTPSGGRLWFRRRALPHRPTQNVVAEQVTRTAHARSSSWPITTPPTAAWCSIQRSRGGDEAHAGSAREGQPERADPLRNLPRPPPAGVVGPVGPPSLEARVLFLSVGAAAVMANIGASRVVPGANDNLSAVATVVALAHALRERPPAGRAGAAGLRPARGVLHGGNAGVWPPPLRRTRPRQHRVRAWSAWAHRSSAWWRGRHAEDALVTDATRERLARAGLDAGVGLRRGLRTVAATDGLIALRAGYPTCTLGGVDDTKFPSNYHWPSDTPDNLLVEHRGCRGGV